MPPSAAESAAEGGGKDAAEGGGKELYYLKKNAAFGGGKILKAVPAYKSHDMMETPPPAIVAPAVLFRQACWIWGGGQTGVLTHACLWADRNMCYLCFETQCFKVSLFCVRGLWL